MTKDPYKSVRFFHANTSCHGNASLLQKQHRMPSMLGVGVDRAEDYPLYSAIDDGFRAGPRSPLRRTRFQGHIKGSPFSIAISYHILKGGNLSMRSARTRMVASRRGKKASDILPPRDNALAETAEAVAE